MKSVIINPGPQLLNKPSLSRLPTQIETLKISTAANPYCNPPPIDYALEA